jgi:hypothetical protein
MLRCMSLLLALSERTNRSSECLLLALSGQTDRARVCPLSDNIGQRWILALDCLSAFDPTETLQSGIAALSVGALCSAGERLLAQLCQHQ